VTLSRHLAAHHLAEYAAGKRTDARSVAHVESCAPCQAALSRVTAARAALADMALLQPPEPSPAAEARAEASIRWTRPMPRARRVRPRVMASLMTTCAFAALTLWLTRDWSLAPGDRSAPRVAARLAPPLDKRLEALVMIVGGDVKVGRALAQPRSLDIASRLGAGDRVTTATSARVAAQWSEGSGFLLLSESELMMTRLEARTQRLNLQRGKVAVRVGPHDQAAREHQAPLDGTVAESLQVSTPDHVVSVHGTWFTVAAAAHVTTVEVLEGTVEVTERDGSSSTLLHAPVRALFARGRVQSSALSVREVARLRGESEMNLMAWPGLVAARAASGTLLVATQPSAQLAMDGVAIGPTTLSLRRPLGRHYVELTRAGFVPLHQWVTVGPEPGELRAAMVHSVAPAPDTAPVEIEDMVRRRATQIRACYERRLKHDPELAGTVSLRLHVGDAGQVTRVDEEQSTLPDPLVGECLRHEAAGWSFAQGRDSD
jgi:ferric-dicitrate binding protein FerR (iron transport regulator)